MPRHAAAGAMPQKGITIVTGNGTDFSHLSEIPIGKIPDTMPKHELTRLAKHTADALKLSLEKNLPINGGDESDVNETILM